MNELEADLLPLEVQALQKFRDESRKPMSLSKALGLFDLFINGYSLQDIADSDPDNLNLPMVVDRICSLPLGSASQRSLAAFDGGCGI